MVVPIPGPADTVISSIYGADLVSLTPKGNQMVAPQKAMRSLNVKAKSHLAIVVMNA